MFVINNNTKYKNLYLFLKDLYDVRIHFRNKNDITMDTLLYKILFQKNKNKPDIFIDENTIIGDLFNIFKNFKIEFRNKYDIKLPNNITLKNCKNYNPKFNTQLSTIDLQIKVAKSIIENHPSYNDIDWATRVLKNAANNISSKEEQILLTETIIKIYENENKFNINELKSILDIIVKFNNDYSIVINVLKDHKKYDLVEIINPS